MKRLIVIASSILFFLAGIAQENLIVTGNKVWSNMQENCEPDGTSYITFFHKFGNDTLLYGRSYNKVMIAEDEDADQWFFDNQYVREENKRIYLMNEFGEEGLLYDFNLELDEKVVIGNELVTEGIHLTFTAIDSVFTADGYRER